jgi:uncharacterized membrane protein YebE (DUF533 family)
MDTKALLDQILNGGRELAETGKSYALQGVDFAADKIGVPGEDGEQRDAMLSGLGKGALAGGILALLLGTKSGRKLSGVAIKIGSVAALGGLAYTAYQKWQQSQGIQTSDAPTNLSAEEASQRSLAVLSAMIGAAKSDGQLDEAERKAITSQVSASELNPEATALLNQQIENPLDVDVIAQSASSPEVAAEMYLASMMVVDQANDHEEAYLKNLAEAMKLEPAFIAQLQSAAS